MDKPPLGTCVPSAVCVWGSDATQPSLCGGWRRRSFICRDVARPSHGGSHVARRLSVSCRAPAVMPSSPSGKCPRVPGR